LSAAQRERSISFNFRRSGFSGTRHLGPKAGAKRITQAIIVVGGQLAAFDRVSMSSTGQ